MKDFLFLCKEIMKGKSVTRAYLNLRLSRDVLKGSVIDIGGGKSSDYLSFMKSEKEFSFVNVDKKAGTDINFETDRLAADNVQYDTVLFLNVMEHIYNYQHIANEVIRITKPGGQLIGFVPFLMWYHADHSDYFRYTHESLKRIFTEANAPRVSIEPIARGPFTAACQMILQSFPKIVRLPVFILFYVLDSVFVRLRPTHGAKYVLGYYFKLNTTLVYE